MARAKRTQRAEARRRHRATLAPESSVELETSDEEVEAVATVGRGRAARSAPGPGSRGAATGQRPSLFGSLRKAAGPADIVGDIRALPDIALHSKAVWIPLALTAVAGILLSIPSTRNNQIVGALLQIVIQPPPMIIAFLAGMLAPRAAWLVGGLTSTIAAAVFAFVYVSSLDATATALGWTRVMAADEKLMISVGLVLQATLFGLAVGAFAGFYRRFLSLSQPPRPARATSGSKTAARRR